MFYSTVVREFITEPAMMSMSAADANFTHGHSLFESFYVVNRCFYGIDMRLDRLYSGMKKSAIEVELTP